MDSVANEKVIVELREKQTKLTNLILAIEAVEGSKEWQVLKEGLLDGLVERLKKQIQTEGLADEVNTDNLYRLQGELKWAKKYADLSEFARTLKVELEKIKQRI